MALPMADPDDKYADEYSERANSLEDYKVTCIQFVADISKDYLAWVDYYKLDSNEDFIRRNGITSIIKRADDWISKIAQSIKGVDVIMNDAIQKMAESTAGKPFPITITVDDVTSYTRASASIVKINVNSIAREGRHTVLGSHSVDNRFRIESTFDTTIDESKLDTQQNTDKLELSLDATKATHNDVVSFTVIVGEHNTRSEVDRRGVTTLIHIN